MSDGAIYSLHHLLLIIGHWELGIGNWLLIVLPHLPLPPLLPLLPLLPLPLLLPHLLISPFLHRAIALKYAVTGI
jgi:hypothetical protein